MIFLTSIQARKLKFGVCLWGPQISYTLNSFEPQIVLETYYSMDIENGVIVKIYKS